ncbi:MAG: hydratase [Burkholderiaceae bacterium]
MTPTEKAARIIWQHMDSGEPLDALPDALRPASRADGYAIQAWLPKLAGDVAVRGWKIAATSAAGREHIGVSSPLAGRILAPYAYADDATVPALGNRMLVAELEFAFVMARPLAPRARSYHVDEVLDAVAELRPSIEFPSSRFDDFVHAGEAQLIADSACAGSFVFGAPAADDWRRIDLRAHRVDGTVVRNDRVALEREGIGANVHGDPRAALTWLVNELSSIGVALSAGQIVSTGTCLAPMAIMPGDEVRGDYGVLGRISARFGHHR